MISYVQLAQDQTQVGCHVQNFVDKWKQVTSDPWVLKIVEEGLRLKFVSKPPKSGVRTTNLLNIVHMSNILEEVKKIIRKRCYRISTTRSGRPGFLQHLFHCSKKRRRSPSNIKLETSQCIHGKFSFQDWNTKIIHSSPPCGGVRIHLRSARCIPTNSHVSTSQEV